MFHKHNELLRLGSQRLPIIARSYTTRAISPACDCISHELSRNKLNNLQRLESLNTWDTTSLGVLSFERY